MKTIFHPASERGSFDFGWLKTYHSFSFGSYRDPKKVRFGALRVLNDDYVKAGEGFPTHPHDNMEIVTLVLNGSLKHEDSMGNSSSITQGEVQRMSAGTGVTHSEYNASRTDDLNLLQIWVFPRHKDVPPSYDQKKLFSDSTQMGNLLLVSPNGDQGSVSINQDAYFSLLRYPAGSKADYTLYTKSNRVYFFLVEGGVKIDSHSLNLRDALGVEDVDSVKVTFTEKSLLLSIEVP